MRTEDWQLVTWVIEYTRKGKIIRSPEFISKILEYRGSKISREEVEEVHRAIQVGSENMANIYKLGLHDNQEKIITGAIKRIQENKPTPPIRNPTARQIVKMAQAASRVIHDKTKQPALTEKALRKKCTEDVRNFIQDPLSQEAKMRKVAQLLKRIETGGKPRGEFETMVVKVIQDEKLWPDIKVKLDSRRKDENARWNEKKRQMGALEIKSGNGGHGEAHFYPEKQYRTNPRTNSGRVPRVRYGRRR